VQVRIRVYATQSTHKTLTALRQGSMIHVRDQVRPQGIQVMAGICETPEADHQSIVTGGLGSTNTQDFKRSVERPFTESFFTHTSTSPNYQILASLDVGRRQMALEGLELVQKARHAPHAHANSTLRLTTPPPSQHTEKALMMRKQLADNPDLNRWFHFLVRIPAIPTEMCARACAMS
jgi:arginine decarboxylase